MLDCYIQYLPQNSAFGLSPPKNWIFKPIGPNLTMNSVCSTKIRPSKKYPEIGRPSRFLSFIIFVAERANDQDEVEAQKPKLFLVTRDAHRGRRSISKEFLILKTKLNINISAEAKSFPWFREDICNLPSLQFERQFDPSVVDYFWPLHWISKNQTKLLSQEWEWSHRTAILLIGPFHCPFSAFSQFPFHFSCFLSTFLFSPSDFYHINFKNLAYLKIRTEETNY